jgi:hypothetical protein
LPRGDLVALLDEQLRDPAGVFRRNIDLGRLDTPVGLGDAVRHALAAQPVDQLFQA